MLPPGEYMTQAYKIRTVATCDPFMIITSDQVVHGPDSLRPSFFAPWTSPNIKSRCHQKKVGMDYLFWAIFKMAAIKIWKSRFVP